jgi:hypothetical protein
MMLYLHLADGTVEELAEAASAAIDKVTEELICLDGVGAEIRRYPRLTITSFSKTPFPNGQSRRSHDP